MPNVARIEQLLSTLYRREDRESPRVVARVSTVISHPDDGGGRVALHDRHSSRERCDVGTEKSNARWMFDATPVATLGALCLSYLELPTPLDAYWRGSSRQNLRTRTNKAKLAGIQS